MIFKIHIYLKIKYISIIINDKKLDHNKIDIANDISVELFDQSVKVNFLPFQGCDFGKIGVNILTNNQVGIIIIFILFIINL